MSNNYIFTILVQGKNDAEAFKKAAEIARQSSEIVYIKRGVRDLGFFTKEGDYGTPNKEIVLK